MIISEWAECFRDMLHLKEKLQEARGELKMEGKKREFDKLNLFKYDAIKNGLL